MATINGSSGKDTLYGSSSNDTLTGGLDNDLLYGYGGNDTYVFSKGAGQDTVFDYNSVVGDADVISFLDVKSTELTAIERSGSHLVLKYGTSDSITVNYFFQSAYQIEQFSFSNGVVWDAAAINERVVYKGTAGNDNLYGLSDFSNRIYGLDGTDFLYGGNQNDVLNGGSGADTLYGGAGDDSYYVDNLNDIIYDASGASDTVYVSVSNYSVSSDIENVIYTNGAKPLPYFVSALVSGYYWGDLGVQRSINYSFALTPTAGLVDFKTYTAAQQQYVREALARYGAAANVTFTEVADAESVDIRFFRDDLSSAGNSGAAGYAYYPDSGDVHIKSTYENYQNNAYLLSHEIGHALGLKHPHEDPALPVAQNNGTNTVMSYSGATSSGALGIFDLAAVHYIYGVNPDARTGNQTYGFADRYIWDGAGIDTFSAADQTSAVNIDLNPGSWIYAGTKADSILAQGQAFIGFGTLIENAIGGAGNDVLLGNTLANRLEGLNGNDSMDGGAGDDTLTGGGGDDSLVGGAGIDTASYEGAAAAVTVTISGSGISSGGAGIDTLSSIENLLGSAHNDKLTGNQSANRLDGGSGNDTLNGSSGNDTLVGGAGIDSMIGGAGDDLFSVDNIADVVTEGASSGVDTVQSSVDFVLGANVENLWLLGAADINGTGNSLDNTLRASAGINVLDGAGGIDTASYADSTAGVTASLSSRKASGGSGNDILQNFENLTGSSYNDSLTGNTLANSLDGGAGADTLNGGSGVDTLTGGDGSDLYYVDNVGDLVVEIGTNPAAGTDLVYTSVSYQLTANVENLRINTTADITATGNSTGNFIYSGAGNNVMDGGLGSDTASYIFTSASVNVSLALAGAAQATGGSGSDTLYGIENLEGSNYSDSLEGDGFANTLSGGKNNDTLKGGGGQDVLNGGSGQDDLTGGLGADTFEYRALAESGTSASGWDRIVDFSHAEGDHIDLYALDANSLLADDQAFVFIGSSSFSAAGQLRYDTSAGMLYGSVDADLDAEFAIQLIGAPEFTAADLVA